MTMLIAEDVPHHPVMLPNRLNNIELNTEPMVVIGANTIFFSTSLQ
jgi:hypothetical protein